MINELPHDDTPEQRTFASVLRRRRATLSLSLAALAQRVGCAKSYLSAIECGHKGPPTESIIDRLEDALSLRRGELHTCAQWDQIPAEIRDDLSAMRKQVQNAHTLAKLLQLSAERGTSLDDLYASGALKVVIDRLGDQETVQDPPPLASPAHHLRAGDQGGLARILPAEVPVINKVTAGYPADFSDMGYPAQTADEYIRTPDLNDPDAFAARVVGDSMEPNYREGDIVVFSPAKSIESGSDCFVRLEPDSESTFKRIYFELDGLGNEMIRIQPINNSYPPRTVPREQVAGLYAGVSVIRSIGF